MQGESDRQRELLDVESMAMHLLEPGSVFALLAEHRDRLFPAEFFADLFPSGRGRPSIPGEVIASVIVLQALHGHSDREAVDALTFDLRWKAACGYAIDAKGFDSSTLTYWRRRLAASDQPQRIFEVGSRRTRSPNPSAAFPVAERAVPSLSLLARTAVSKPSVLVARTLSRASTAASRHRRPSRAACSPSSPRHCWNSMTSALTLLRACTTLGAAIGLNKRPASAVPAALSIRSSRDEVLQASCSSRARRTVCSAIR